MNPFNDPDWRDFRNDTEFIRDVWRSRAKGEIDPEDADNLIRWVQMDECDGEHKHNITSEYMSALYAQGADDIADAIGEVSLVVVESNMAVGLKGKTTADFHPDHLDDRQKDAMLRALRGVLKYGGINVEVVGDRLRMFPPKEEPDDPWIEHVRQFRDELDQDDPLSKWMQPPEEKS